ncbi:MAG: hypothetical protein J6Y03_05670 [Alphaproteobacteria bacterium]|nr:hypothetical protein [Alphaproteobacteria bacterium]
MEEKIFNEKLALAENTAKFWHKGVDYGGKKCTGPDDESGMFAQVKGTAQKVSAFYHINVEDKQQVEEKQQIVLTAYLYKALEVKRLNEKAIEARKNATKEDVLRAIAHNFSPEVASIVEELAGEPEEDKSQTKEQQWQEKTKWAMGLSHQAKVILLAEKLQNFEVSYKNPNPKKPPEWHIEYYKTRMIMVEALRDACPALYEECVKYFSLGVNSLSKENSIRVIGTNNQMEEKALSEAKQIQKGE